LGGDPDDRKSTAGYVFILGSRPVTWACKKQQAISLSSTEAEYEQWLMQVKKPCGFDRSFQSLDSNNNI
jgi:hypothetical protein